jgi:hypothetical protein
MDGILSTRLPHLKQLQAVRVSVWRAQTRNALSLVGGGEELVERISLYRRTANRQHLSGSTPTTKSDIAGDVIVKAGNTPKRRRIDRNKTTITHAAARTSVKNHNANQFKATVDLLIKSMRKRSWPLSLSLSVSAKDLEPRLEKFSTFL